MNPKNTNRPKLSKLITVTGEISCDDIDIISPHEHVLIDIRNQFTEFEEITLKRQSEQKVTIEKLGALSRNPYALKDNLVMDDEDLAEKELMNFKKAGGVPKMMRDLVEWINNSIIEEISPVIITGASHYEFVSIHPFLDGNGRTARTLATLILYKSGYDTKRLFSSEEYYDQDLAGYWLCWLCVI